LSGYTADPDQDYYTDDAEAPENTVRSMRFWITAGNGGKKTDGTSTNVAAHVGDQGQQVPGVTNPDDEELSQHTTRYPQDGELSTSLEPAALAPTYRIQTCIAENTTHESASFRAPDAVMTDAPPAFPAVYEDHEMLPPDPTAYWSYQMPANAPPTYTARNGDYQMTANTPQSRIASYGDYRIPFSAPLAFNPVNGNTQMPFNARLAVTQPYQYSQMMADAPLAANESDGATQTTVNEHPARYGFDEDDQRNDSFGHLLPPF
jgi:hypothetical protein